ncbi:Putative tagatose-6-phosphate ketose/aldose isomerase [Citrobacter amalonaticus]|nr:Putative tagatose-6-phosphate ketose/aldose isomerase [Citrobacter amalonaticus]
MPETYTPAAATTGTWTEEEIRQQPASWIRSLTNIDAIRTTIDNFLAPLLRNDDLRIVLTGGRYLGIHWRDHLSLACQPHGAKHQRRSDHRSGHQSDGLSESGASAAAGLVCPFRQ